MFITRKLQKFKKVANTDEHDVMPNLENFRKYKRLYIENTPMIKMF